jgi:hypothetical protein
MEHSWRGQSADMTAAGATIPVTNTRDAMEPRKTILDSLGQLAGSDRATLRYK